MATRVTANVIKAIRGISEKIGNGHVDIGFLDGAKYPDGTGVAEVAFTNEYGVPSNNQPPRLYFRRMIAKEKPTWGAAVARGLKTGRSGPLVLQLVGDNIQGALIQSINDLTDPPLSPVTIAKKGFDKPLIDTAVMVNHTGVEVSDK